YPSNLNSNNVKIYLDGEAYFDVVKKKNRKYVINTSSINIEVLGTSFNVKSYSDENTIETTLENGTILINSASNKNRFEKAIILNPNQKATFIKNTEKIKISDISTPGKISNQKKNEKAIDKKESIKPNLVISKQIDTELYTSWKDGRMVFRKENFYTLSKKMERWYDVQITILDEDLHNWKYTGVFEKETIEQALEALSLSMPFQYEIDQNKIFITKKL
ncbi:FecR family protein, partial [Bacteroidota bacterium]